MVVTASGRAGGQPKSVVVHRPYGMDLDTRRRFLKTIGTVDPYVAAPAVAAARLTARGEAAAGVMPVEALDPVALPARGRRDHPARYRGAGHHTADAVVAWARRNAARTRAGAAVERSHS